MTNTNKLEQLNRLKYTPERFFWELLKAGMRYKVIKINNAYKVRNSYDYNKTAAISLYLYKNFKDSPAKALEYLLDTPASEVLAKADYDSI